MGWIGRLKTMIRRKYFPSIKDAQFLAYEKWLQDDGEHKFRYNYNLDENSIVFDCGGYHGDFAAEIAARYQCYVYIFEPVKDYYRGIKDRFSRNEKIKVYPLGIAGRTEECPIFIGEDASSQYNSFDGEASETMQLKSIVEFLTDNHIAHVDLIKLI